MSSRLNAMLVDITTLSVDGIVNAANNSLLGGGGVDGAIHKTAGPGLLKACKNLAGCATGAAKITLGFNLPARFVIHTVGPVWSGGLAGEEKLLASCYRESLALADQQQLKTIAFPAVSCGIYGYPIGLATKIAVETSVNYLRDNHIIEQIIFACFNREILRSYQQEFVNQKLRNP